MLLKQIGLPFRIFPSKVRENVLTGETPKELVKRLSYEKAIDVVGKIRNGIVIGADTIVVLQGKIMGKPSNARVAKEMLKALNGKSHSIFSGLTVFDSKTGRAATKVVETKVFFRKLTDSEISGYSKTREPLDKAGAYAIQGKAAWFIEKIEGDFSNVIGLPLAALAEMLQKFKIIF